MKKLILFISIVLLGFVATAQTKVGYLNTQELIKSMPESKVIDSTFKIFQSALTKQFNSMVEDFKTKNDEFVKDSLTFLPSIKEVKRSELQSQVEKIKNFEEQANKDLISQREILLKPLTDKIKNAINKVAKENNFDYILDTSTTSLVFVNEKYNVLSLVKKALK